MRCAGNFVSNTVDIFNAMSGVWTNATLSVARYVLAATSLPNEGLAIFAGGLGASYVLMSVIARGWCVGRGMVLGRYCCNCSCTAQSQVHLATWLTILWTSSMRRAVCGPTPTSASLDIVLQPHRCRMRDWRYSPAAQVRRMCR